MSRRAQLFLFLSAALVQCTVGFHVTYVVSVCRERRLSFIDTSIDILRVYGRNHTAQVVIYCKCTLDKAMDGRRCHNLPNVGRESHTHLAHIVSSYTSTAPNTEHVLFFVNGGSASKRNAAENVFSISRRLAELDRAPAYVDDAKTVTHEQRAARRHEPGTNADFVKAAFDHCFVGGDYLNRRTPDEVYGEKPRKCPCRAGPIWCELFSPTTCPEGSKLLFQPQLNCSWRGTSSVNYGDSYDPSLPPSDPPAFTDWMLARWGVNAWTWEETGWACCGNFAVSAAVVREWPLRVYQRAHDEIAGMGNTGGTVVMFLERAWRSIFSLPPAPV